MHHFSSFSNLSFNSFPVKCSNGFALCILLMGFPRDSVVKNVLANVRDMGSIPGGWEGRLLGEGNGSVLAWEILWADYSLWC